jgi:hypothetical protein
MKAMVLHELGGPDKLIYEDIPEPEPGPGETVVRLHAAALNRRDVFVTQGQYPGAKPDALPIILGSDGSGEVVARRSTGAMTRESPARNTASSVSRTTAPSPSSSRSLPRTSFPSRRTSRTRRPPPYRSAP